VKSKDAQVPLYQRQVPAGGPGLAGGPAPCPVRHEVSADSLVHQGRLALHLDGDFVGAGPHVPLQVEPLPHVGAVLRDLALRRLLAVDGDGEGRLAPLLRHPVAGDQRQDR
jgi:hypothetical protein